MNSILRYGTRWNKLLIILGGISAFYCIIQNIILPKIGANSTQQFEIQLSMICHYA